MVDAAVCLLRYSAFMPSDSTDPHSASDIAGDNSMYLRAELAAHIASTAEGFWEVEVWMAASVRGGS